MARILLLGAGGMLGGALLRELAPQHAVTAPLRGAFDILRSPWDTLPVAGHDWVVNAAGLIPRRDAPAEQSWIVNAAFPQALAALGLRHGARLLHVSTDCVFAGRDGPHDEAAVPDATDTYGLSKRFGEPCTAMVLRASIIGPEDRGQDNLLRWVLRQRAIDGYGNHLWNGLTTAALAALVGAVIARDRFLPGLHHVHGETVSKDALVGLICRAWGHAADIRPVAAPAARDQRLATLRPEMGALLPIPPLAAQLTALAARSTPDGRWRDAPPLPQEAAHV